MKRNERRNVILKDFVAEFLACAERRAVKNQVTSVLCSTFDSFYWRDCILLYYFQTEWNISLLTFWQNVYLLANAIQAKLADMRSTLRWAKSTQLLKVLIFEWATRYIEEDLWCGCIWNRNKTENEFCCKIRPLDGSYEIGSAGGKYYLIIWKAD